MIWGIVGILILVLLIYFTLKIYREIDDAKTFSEDALEDIKKYLNVRYEVMQELIDYSSGRIKEQNRYIIKLLEAKLIPISERAVVETELTEELKDLMYKVESMPEFVGRKETTELKLALTKAEKNIYDAEVECNEKIEAYNKLTKRFPKNLVAKIGGFKPKEIFEIGFVTR